MRHKIKDSHVRCIAIAALLLLAAPATFLYEPPRAAATAGGFAQSGEADQQDDTRGIWDTGLRQKRPASTPGKRIKYRRVTSPMATAKTATALPADQGEGAVIGLTFWRLRPSTEADDRETRMLEHRVGNKPDVQLTAERVEGNTAFSIGDRVRLTIESPRKGYLYVIDRERYENGSLGTPELIFPTLNIRGGDNQVSAGRMIDIPDQSDKPPFWWVNPRQANLVGEELTIIVIDQPLAGLSIGREALKLTEQQVTEWQKKWAAGTEQIEMEGGAGQVYTKTEKDAGANGTRMLTQDDPLPQTIFHVMVKPGKPLLVIVPLNYRS